MGKGRLEAFSDGVMAIIITIMVLELRAPHGTDIRDLQPLIPVFLCYVLSFTFIGIYWNNHHHMFHIVQKINGSILWHNLHLLFWLSLIPFVTSWMGENHFCPWPVALYGIVLLMAGFAYYFLTHALIKQHGKDSALAVAVGADKKGIISVVIYAIAIPLSFIQWQLAFVLYVLVALTWFVPDSRIEKVLSK